MTENRLNEEIKHLTPSEKIEVLELIVGIRLLVKTSPELANLAIHSLLLKSKEGHFPKELDFNTWNLKERMMS